ncbi:MAG: hypothetical protein H0V82_09140 [Candidatus Protochlamydia sp.]|nr:hypothetical protein [Candidatus Protochlamydia sp.]
MNNITTNLDPYIQLSNAILTFDSMESSANALGRNFTNISDSQCGASNISNKLQVNLDTQNFQLEAKYAKETIQAIRLISPEAAEDLKTRYQFIVEGLYANVSKKGLKETQAFEKMSKNKLALMKNNLQNLTVLDELEMQMLMNDQSDVFDLSLNTLNSISKYRNANANKATYSDPYEQLSEGISTLDRIENSAHKLGKFFTQIIEYRPDIVSNKIDKLNLTLANQDLELETKQARKAIKGIKLISPEAAAELSTRYQSILEGLSTTVNDIGLYEGQLRETLIKQKHGLMKERKDSLSFIDSLEMKMLMNEFANISTITANIANSIQKQRI